MPNLQPRFQAPARQPREAPSRTTRKQATERLTRILLVEDEPLTAEVFAQALTRDGHEVEIARDGLQALRRLSKRLPTAIVLDMNLPAVSGVEVIRRLRADGHEHLPIIIVSGSSPAAVDLGTLPLEPGVWLEKPVKPRELVSIVRSFIDGETS